MGYDRAKNCVHIPYGQVVLPDGKMSSRKGTVIFFSQLRNLLNDDIYTNFLTKYDPDRAEEPAAAPAPVVQADGKVWTKVEKSAAKWTRSEVDAAQQQIAVATIKYGMLNHDVAKDIVFVLEEWTAKSGNTGPYMLYAYARIQSIIREVKVAPDAQVDFTLLTHDADRIILTLLHELWDVLDKAVEAKNPSTLCNYLFDLSKAFSSWYEIPSCSVSQAQTEDLKATRVEFIRAIAKVIKFGMNLLGIQTLERM
jgi:arginyl-tRNA synthetase